MIVIEFTSINGVRIHQDIVRNLSRILGWRLFKFKNINPIVVVNSYTHVYIKFIDKCNSCERSESVCQIDIFTDRYVLDGSKFSGYIIYDTKGFIRDRWRVYKWLHSVINKYRNRGDKT